MKPSAYARYKPSGVEWLGELPEHWKLDRLKRSVARCKNGIWGDEAQQDENDVICVRVADFDRQSLKVELNDPTIRNVTEKDRTGRVLKRGDLLLEKSGGGENQPVGCVVLYDDPQPAVCSNFVARMQIADGMCPAYWRYIHAAAYAIRLTTRSINQTSGIQNLDQDRYFDEQVPFPPLEEQQTIADFLDAQTAKIDTLLAKKRQFIDKLKEKRSALIARTVTRGLPPTAAQAAGLEAYPAMKDSGVEWLGHIPAHWEVKPLKHVANRSEIKVEADEDNPLPYIGLEHVESWTGRLLPLDEELMPTGISNYFKSGDTLFGKLRPYLVKACNVDFDGLCSSELLVLRGKDYAPQFLLYQLLSDGFIKLVDSSTYGSKMPRASWDFIGSCELPTPPLEEQQAIAAYLDRETARIAQLTAKVETAVARLTEYRQALITAAVTGKIDVRTRLQKEDA